MRLLKSIALIAVCLACMGRVQAASAATKKNTEVKTAPHKNNVATSKKTTASQKARSSRRTSTKSSWRAGQTQPATERYRELQEALAKKGYLQGAPTGVWDQASVDALRRFQHDQNLEASGKIDSLSVIALGLGPKYEASAGKPAAPR